MEAEIEKVVTEFIERVLFFIGVVASVDVVADISEENTYLVSLSGEDLGVIIGYHGEALASLQNVLGLDVGKKLGKWPRLVVDVNGYRRDREEKVKEMARKAVERAKLMSRPVELPPMMAFDRRVAHMEIAKHDGVVSESIGQGYNRRVVVTPNQG